MLIQCTIPPFHRCDAHISNIMSNTCTPQVYDAAVIGGGPVGLATAYEIAKAGKSVILLEKRNFFNQAGSSNDLARMFRTMFVAHDLKH